MKNAIKRLIGEEFNSLLIMNLITVLLCIPVVTIGPALFALNGTLIKILDDRCSLNRISEYWSTFKAKLLPGILYELIAAGYLLIILWAQSLAELLGESGAFLSVWTTGIGILAAMVFAVGGVIMSGVKQPLAHSLWNSVLFAFGHLPKMLLSTAIIFGMLCVGYLLYPISLLPAAVIMISLTSALSISCIWPEYQADVLNQCSE